jgi:hypothetical protein
VTTLETLCVSEDCYPYHDYELKITLPNLKTFTRRKVGLLQTWLSDFLNVENDSDGEGEEETNEAE